MSDVAELEAKVARLTALVARQREALTWIHDQADIIRGHVVSGRYSEAFSTAEFVGDRAFDTNADFDGTTALAEWERLRQERDALAEKQQRWKRTQPIATTVLREMKEEITTLTVERDALKVALQDVTATLETVRK